MTSSSIQQVWQEIRKQLQLKTVSMHDGHGDIYTHDCQWDGWHDRSMKSNTFPARRSAKNLRQEQFSLTQHQCLNKIHWAVK